MKLNKIKLYLAGITGMILTGLLVHYDMGISKSFVNNFLSASWVVLIIAGSIENG